MRLEQLQYLIDIADTHSITGTAQNFFISQQAVSNSLKQLENEMNAVLLVRNPSGVLFTEQGQEMLAFARRVLADLAQTKSRLALMQDASAPTVGQTIRICSNSIINSLLMPKVLRLLQRQSKAISISITELSFDKMFDALLADEYDMAFASINNTYFVEQMTQYQHHALAYNVLLYDRNVACMHRQSPYARQISIDNNELLHHIPHTIYSIAPIDEYKANNFFGALLCSNDVEFHKNLLLQNQTLTLMSELTYRHLFKDRRLMCRPIHYATDSDQSIVHTLVYKTPLPPVCTELIALIEESLHTI